MEGTRRADTSAAEAAAEFDKDAAVAADVEEDEDGRVSLGPVFSARAAVAVDEAAGK